MFKGRVLLRFCLQMLGDVTAWARLDREHPYSWVADHPISAPASPRELDLKEEKPAPGTRAKRLVKKLALAGLLTGGLTIALNPQAASELWAQRLMPGAAT